MSEWVKQISTWRTTTVHRQERRNYEKHFLQVQTVGNLHKSFRDLEKSCATRSCKFLSADTNVSVCAKGWKAESREREQKGAHSKVVKVTVVALNDD
jgi:hypothetical protein